MAEPAAEVPALAIPLIGVAAAGALAAGPRRVDLVHGDAESLLYGGQLLVDRRPAGSGEKPVHLLGHAAVAEVQLLDGQRARAIERDEPVDDPPGLIADMVPDALVEPPVAAARVGLDALTL